MALRAPLLLLAITLGAGLFAQEVPQATLDAFHARHPDAGAVEWSHSTGLYRAQFLDQGILRTVDLDEQGQVLVEGRVKQESELTQAERGTLATEFPGYRVVGVRSTSTASRGTFTEVMLTDGKKRVEVLLDDQGRMAAANERK